MRKMKPKIKNDEGFIQGTVRIPKPLHEKFMKHIKNLGYDSFNEGVIEALEIVMENELSDSVDESVNDSEKESNKKPKNTKEKGKDKGKGKGGKGITIPPTDESDVDPTVKAMIDEVVAGGTK